MKRAQQAATAKAVIASEAPPMVLEYEDGQVLTVAEVEARSIEEIRYGNLELVARGWDPIREKPFGGSERWEAFKAQLREGDELQWFAKIMGPRAARLGLVIMRPGPSLADSSASRHAAAHYIVAMA